MNCPLQRHGFIEFADGNGRPVLLRLEDIRGCWASSDNGKTHVSVGLDRCHTVRGDVADIKRQILGALHEAEDERIAQEMIDLIRLGVAKRPKDTDTEK